MGLWAINLNLNEEKCAKRVLCVCVCGGGGAVVRVCVRTEEEDPDVESLDFISTRLLTAAALSSMIWP